jgi:hypothetical protein
MLAVPKQGVAIVAKNTGFAFDISTFLLSNKMQREKQMFQSHSSKEQKVAGWLRYIKNAGATHSCNKSVRPTAITCNPTSSIEKAAFEEKPSAFTATPLNLLRK